MSNYRPESRPKVREIDERIDFVVQALIDGCDAPVTVWIEKFWPAFTKLILAWYTIDFLNAFKAYLKPGLFAIEGRSTRHWGKGEKGKRRTVWRTLGHVASIDVGEFLGAHLWGADELRARPLPPGATWLWIFDGLIERFLWYMMVLDLVTDFAYTWSSSVMETRYCQMADDPVFLGEKENFPLLALFGWDPLGALTPVKMRNLSFFNGFGVGAVGGGGGCGFTATIKNETTFGDTRHIECRVIVVAGPSAGREEMTTYAVPAGAEIGVGCGMSIQRGDIVEYQTRVDNTLTCVKCECFYQQAFTTFQ